MANKPEASFTIQHETSDTKGRYVVELNGAKAEMTYSKAGDGMIIIEAPKCLMPCAEKKWGLL